MSFLDFGTIALRTIEATSTTCRNVTDHQQAWMAKRLQAVAAQPLDPQAVLEWRTRRLICSRLKNFAYRSRDFDRSNA
jgi:hypothetical protein